MTLREDLIDKVYEGQDPKDVPAPARGDMTDLLLVAATTAYRELVTGSLATAGVDDALKKIKNFVDTTSLEEIAERLDAIQEEISTK